MMYCLITPPLSNNNNMQKSNTTLQHILKSHAYTAQTPYTQHVLKQLEVCRTKALGYHLYKCDDHDCASIKYQYHSCRNRHCPQCGGLQKKQWVEDRQRELLPVPYYHVVFTLPHQLNAITMGNRTVMYNLLFKAVSTTLLQFAKDKKYLGAQPGILAVLHSWGQQLSFHPHVHCVVSAGGMVKKQLTNGKEKIYWAQMKRKGNQFLFPVKAMSLVYRAIFIKEFNRLIQSQELSLTTLQQSSHHQLLRQLWSQPWVVYAKKPFGGPQQVVQYLAAYTHKVAITNQRITGCNDQGQVQLRYKDYRTNQQKTMHLPAEELIRRFEQHILPRGFTKIRTYGYLANRARHTNLKAITTVLKLPAHPPVVKTPWQLRLYEMYGIRYNQCPHCQRISMVLLQTTYQPTATDSS
jgi:Putative transposase/Transposase zinc-binding domain